MTVVYSRDFLLKFRHKYTSKPKRFIYDLEKINYISIFENDGNIDLTNTKKEIRSILNKLSDDNFKILSKQLRSIIAEKYFDIFNDSVISTTSSQIKFSYQYASLYTLFTDKQLIDSLLIKLKNSFHLYKNDIYTRKNLMKFIGNLFKLKILPMSDINFYFETLLEESDIESNCTFLTIIGKYLKSFKCYLNKLKQIDTSNNMRMYFMIADLEELSKTTWKI